MPTATYFFSKEKARPYINAGMGFIDIKQKANTLSSSGAFSSYENNNNGFIWSVGGGLAYFISKSISFDLGLDYAKYTYEEDGVKIKSGAIGANIGISVFLK